MKSKFVIIMGTLACILGDYAHAQSSYGSIDILGNLTVSQNVGISGNLAVSEIFFTSVNKGSIAFGEGASVGANRVGVALGRNATVSGYTSFALGDNSVAGGNFAVAMGLNAQSYAGSGISLGANTRANGSCSLAVGAGAQTNAMGSISGGYNTITLGEGSIALGRNTTSESYGQVSLGIYNSLFSEVSTNSWVGTDPLLVVGNGQAASNRSNALVIQKNGDATLSGTLRVMKPSSAIPMGEFGAPSAE